VSFMGEHVLNDAVSKTRTNFWFVFLVVSLIAFYCGIAWLARGEYQWWYIDFVADANVYWGDDSYRYFLAKTAFRNPDVYWFNFVLPLAVFFDGVLTTISNESLYYSRALKSFPLVLSVFLVYFTCLKLDVKRVWAFLSAGMLAFFPLYVFVSLSFYGESWLVFFICLALFLLADKKMRAAALVIGLMPLIRGESIGFVASFSLFALLQRDRKLLFWALAPGSIYFCLITTIGPGLQNFLGWRLNVADVFEAVGIWYGGEIERVFDVLYLPWLLIAVPALFLKEARPIWPCAIGAFYIVARLLIAVELDRSSLEPRFFLGVIPVLVVGLALGLNKLNSFCGSGQKAICCRVMSVGFMGLLLFLHVSSVHVANELIDYVARNGELPPSVADAPLEMGTYFKKADSETVAGYREYAEIAMQMLERNPAVTTLMVSESSVLYFLDPKRIPRHVKVVFALFGWPTLRPVMEGDVTTGYFPHPPFSAYFALGLPKEGESLLLYLDDMKVEKYPYHWIVKGNSIYLFSAKEIEGARIKKMSKDDYLLR